MEYNTSRPQLIIREYGRNIQKMVEHCCGIEDREARNKEANAIIQVMGQLNPHLRDVADFKHKLWDHLFIIADFKLDIDSPYPIPSAETLDVKPDRIEYPSSEIKYRHYGRVIEKIIEKAIDYPDGIEKQALNEAIANHLKKSYINWNRDSVSDDVIFENLDELSQGKIKLNESIKLHQYSDTRHHNTGIKKKRRNQKGGKKNKRGYR